MSTLLDQLIAAEVRLANPTDDAVELINALVQTSVKARDDGSVEVLDRANGRGRLSTSGAGITVRELLDEIRSSRPALFKPAAATEAGDNRSQGASVPEEENPWSRQTWNITKQHLLERRDPELAARLHADARRDDHAR